MLTTLKKYKRILIGILTIIIIIFMIIMVDFRSLLNKIFLITLWGIVLFMAFYTITFILRTFKLKLIFQGLNNEISFNNSYFSTGICFLLNALAPAKLGELAKISILKDKENLKFSESFGGIAIERVLDLIALFLISFFILIFLYFSNFQNDNIYTLLGINLRFYITLGFLFLIGLLLLTFLLFYKSEFIINIIRKISLRLAEKLLIYIQNFKIAIIRFKNHKRKLLAILIIEGLIWIFECMMGVLVFYLLGFELNIFIIILAQIIIFFSKAFPLTPGGWVISENLGALFILLFYPSISYTDILSIFIIDHLIRLLYVFIYGSSSMVAMNFNLSEIDHLNTINQKK